MGGSQASPETVKLVWENLLEAELNVKRYASRAVRWRRWRRWADFTEVLGATGAFVSFVSQATPWLSGGLILAVAVMAAAKEGFRVPEQAEKLEVAARTWTDRVAQWGKLWTMLKLHRPVDSSLVLAHLDSDLEADRASPILPFKTAEILKKQDEVEFAYLGPSKEEEPNG